MLLDIFLAILSVTDVYRHAAAERRNSSNVASDRMTVYHPAAPAIEINTPVQRGNYTSLRACCPLLVYKQIKQDKLDE
jgi:hypothetical protein